MEKTTGFHVDYYLVEIKEARRGVTGIVECDDVIEALGLTFAEGCVFKEIWRTARARQGVGKPGHTQRYGREKVLHYAEFLYNKEVAGD